MNEDITYFKDTSVKISRQDYAAKKSDMLLHDHDFLTVSFLLSGSLIEHTPKATKIVRPGNILIKPPSLMHGDLFTEDCSILSFKIYDWEYYDFNRDAWEILSQPGSIKHFLNVVNNTDKKESLMGLEKMLGSVINTKKKATARIPDRIKQVKKMVDVHFLESLKISELAKEVNLHPVYLGNAFKAHYTMDIKTYQQQLRMHFAVSKMIAKKDSLTQISYATGYADQSHFSREFKKSTNFSPKKFTALLNL